mgnify:FL=1
MPGDYKNRKLLVIIMILASCSCYDADKTKTSDSTQVDIVNFEQKEYYYELSQKDIDRFLKKVSSLKKGMSVDDVIKVLGRPDNIQEIRGKEPDSPYRGQMLTYYLKIWKKDFVNIQRDSHVLIIFNEFDKMEEYDITLR